MGRRYHRQGKAMPSQAASLGPTHAPQESPSLPPPAVHPPNTGATLAMLVAQLRGSGAFWLRVQPAGTGRLGLCRLVLLSGTGGGWAMLPTGTLGPWEVAATLPTSSPELLIGGQDSVAPLWGEGLGIEQHWPQHETLGLARGNSM